MSVSEWAFVGLFFALGWTLPALPIVAGKLLAPQRPNPAKSDTYECGVQPFGDTQTQFRAQYYIYALVYVVFGVEIAFLAIWALAYNRLGLFALFEMAVFILLLVVALIFVWRKGALRWA